MCTNTTKHLGPFKPTPGRGKEGDRQFSKERFRLKNFAKQGPITSYEEACWQLGLPEQNWHGREEDEIAYIKLKTIIEGLNGSEAKRLYYPFFWLYSGDDLTALSEKEIKAMRLIDISGICKKAAFAEVEARLVSKASSGMVNPYLCLKSAQLAIYCGEHFIELWADFFNPVQSL